MPTTSIHTSSTWPEEPEGAEVVVPGLDELVSARQRLGRITIIVVMVSYVGFFLLVAFAYKWLGMLISAWGSLAFVAMIFMYVVAWATTWQYLRHSGQRIQPLETKVREALLRKSAAVDCKDSSK